MLGRNHHAVKLRIVATKSLVAFLTFLLAFGTTPAQLWAEGAEGLAQVAEGAVAAAAQTEAEPAEDEVGETSAAPADGADDSEGSDASAPKTEQAAEPAEPVASQPQSESALNDSKAVSTGEEKAPSPQTADTQVAPAQTAPTIVATSTRAKTKVDIRSVTVSGATEVGSLLTTEVKKGPKTFYQMGDPITANDDVSYQWQYAETNSVKDEDFHDIPGATEATYTIPATIDGRDAAGLYVRVLAKSNNVQPSTKNAMPIPPFETDGKPFGPITVKGQYALGSVSLSSTKKIGSNSFFQVGATVTPAVKLSTGGAVPSGANLTYTWYRADSEKDKGEKLPADSYDASNGQIKLDAAWEGTYLYATVSAGANTVQSEHWLVMAKDTFQLVGTNLNPASGTLTSLTDDVKVNWVQARALNSNNAVIFNASITNTKGLSFHWYVSNSKTGPWTELEDETDSSLKPIPAQAGGKHLKVVVSSGDSKPVEKIFPNKIVDGNSLGRIANRLKSQTFKLAYGTDANFNDVVKAKLKQLGYDDVNVRVKSAAKTTSKDYVTVGISMEDGATNGDITFASFDPDEGYSSSDDWKVKVTLELSRVGEQVACALTKNVSIPLDAETMTTRLEEAVKDFSFEFADGDAADSVTQGFVVPQTHVAGKSWIAASWKIDPADVIALPNVFADPCTVTRRATDTKVTLTATFRMSSYSKVSTERTFTITVKGDPSVKPEEVTASVSVIGADTAGAEQTWVDTRDQTVPAGSTVADLSMAAFKSTGLTYEATGEGSSWMLSTIASPSDPNRKLGWDQATGRYWQLFINGKAAQAGAGGIRVSAGDAVVWRYAADDAPAPSEKISVTAYIVGRDAAGNEQMWAEPTTVQVDKGATAADVTMELCKQTGIGLSYDPESTFGWFLTSMTSPYDPSVKLLSWDQQTGESWQLFYDGKYAQVGAGSIEVEAGKTVAWYYGKGQVLPGLVSTDVEVIGRDANGNAQTWASAGGLSLVKGATAADATTRFLADKNLSAIVTGSGDTWELTGLTSPHDENLTLKNGQGNGARWKLFVDGQLADTAASKLEVASGSKLTWCYTDGDELPDPDALVIDPTAPRPDYEASWGSFAHGENGAVIENVLTPSETARVKWTYNYRSDSPWASASDPLIVNGDIYFLSDGVLVKIDGETGHEEARVNLGGSNKYFCRPVYSGGLIIVPFDDGSVAGITADTLACVWKTAALKKPVINGVENSYQALSSLTVANGCVYAGFTVPGGVNAGRAGALVCVRISDGSVLWTRTSTSEDSGHAEGYYWAGAVASGSDIVIGDESGAVSLIDGATGAVKSTVSVQTPIRATMVSAGTEGGRQVYLAVSRDDGTLYKVYRDGDALELGKGVAFAAESTSTPAVSGGRAYVCGVDAEGYGALSVIDLASMTVIRTVRADKGKSQSSPLVSVVNGSTYVYFTCNALPGGVYLYRDGDAEVRRLFTPDADQQQYCTASIVADEQGNLYYTNDSGVLFALAAAGGWRVSFDTQGGSEQRDIMVPKGQALNAPADPEREGYTFAGWYLDAEGTRAWDFSDVVTGDMTLFAVWRKDKDDDDTPDIDNGIDDGDGDTDTDNNTDDSTGDDDKEIDEGGDSAPPATSLRDAAGFIAPGKSPIKKASLSSATSAPAADATRASREGDAESGAAAVALSAERAGGSRATADAGNRLPVAVGLGVAGVAGLIAAGLWFSSLKRRG